VIAGVLAHDVRMSMRRGTGVVSGAICGSRTGTRGEYRVAIHDKWIMNGKWA